MKFLHSVLVLAGLMLPVAAVAENPFAGVSHPDAARYRACMKAVADNPQAALEAAHLWREHEGGAPAKHCLGAALMNLDRYAEAAAWLEEAAADARDRRGVDAMGAIVTPGLVAELWAQAGNAWLMAEDPDRALKDFSTAISSLPPGSPASADINLDRAIAVGMKGDYTKAVEYLTQVLKQDPNNIDALLLRAIAHRHLDEPDLAETDLSRILRLDPENGDALMERGAIREAEGDELNARRDWIRAVVFHPGTELAELALDNLERIQVLN